MAGSGNQPSEKGDVKDGFNWLVENKSTIGNRYSLRLSDWRKIKNEAIRAGREPVIQLDMNGERLAIIDQRTWLMLRDLLG